MTTPHIHHELARRQAVEDASRGLEAAHAALEAARRAHAAALAEQRENASAAACATDERRLQRIAAEERHAVQRVTETFLDAQRSERRIRAARDRLAAAVAEAREEVAAELADEYRVLHGCLISALLSAAEAHELVREAGAKAREVGFRLPHQPLVPPALASMLDNATPHSRDGARVEGPMARLLSDAKRHGYPVNDHPMKYSTLKCRRRAA